MILVGRFAEGRAEAKKLAGRLKDQGLESEFSLVMLASYALEGDLVGRARQFESVLEQFKKRSSEGKPRQSQFEWNFGGLVNAIRSSSISAESKFLVLTAIDMQQGKLANGDLSFFSASNPQAAESKADAGLGRQAAS